MLKKIYTFTATESKALIAKGIIALPEIQKALKEGNVFVSRGSTNSYILEECYKLTNTYPKDGFNNADYVVGQICMGKKNVSLTVNPGPLVKETYFEKGVPKFAEDRLEIVSKFQEGDIVLKGANALDPNGMAGVFMGNLKGGTIGALIGCIMAKGIKLIIPVGLNKLVYNTIEDISLNLGANNMLSPPEGMKLGMMPMTGTVFTELEALEQIFMVEAMHVGSGGLGDAAGCVSILISAEEQEEIKKIDKLLEELAGIPPFKENKSKK